MDVIDIEIREDGTVVVTSDQVSIANHRNADQLLGLLSQLMGGEVHIEPRKKNDMVQREEKEWRRQES